MQYIQYCICPTAVQHMPVEAEEAKAKLAEWKALPSERKRGCVLLAGFGSARSLNVEFRVFRGCCFGYMLASEVEATCFEALRRMQG